MLKMGEELLINHFAQVLFTSYVDSAAALEGILVVSFHKPSQLVGISPVLGLLHGSYNQRPAAQILGCTGTEPHVPSLPLLEMELSQSVLNPIDWQELTTWCMPFPWWFHPILHFHFANSKSWLKVKHLFLPLQVSVRSMFQKLRTNSHLISERTFK